MHWEGRVAGFAEVSDLLWRERELLDVLAFKLDQERLLIADGNVRWLARATREIDLVLEQIRLTELGRAVEVEALAGELELEASPDLATLARHSPAPWGECFAAHGAAFMTLTEQIGELAASNRRALDEAWRAADEALLAQGAGTAG
jgi:FlgN protein